MKMQTLNDHLNKKLITADENDTAADIALLMRKHSVGAIPIMQNEELVGIVSERDIASIIVAEGLSAEATPAKDFMTRDLTVYNSDESYLDFFHTLGSLPNRHLPILEKGKIVGMLSDRDIVSGLSKKEDHLKRVFFDEKFKHNKVTYFFQTVLTTTAMFIVLLLLDFFSNAVLVAALGASCFIAFAMPHRDISSPRYMIGGYAVGALTGAACAYAASSFLINTLPIAPAFHYVFFGALAVGSAMFFMVLTDTEHPPAASLSLGLVLGHSDLQTIAIVLFGIASLSLIKEILKPLLKDLL
jgi:CBS-domain-containing membrane protein